MLMCETGQGSIQVTQPHDALTKNGLCSFTLSTTHFLLSWSPTAHLSASAVAGLSSTRPLSPSPFCFLAALTASLSAKNTVEPRNKGGSPTPLLLAIDRRCFQLMGLPSVSCFNMLTLNSRGMSPNPGILYVPGPVVDKQPVLEFQRDSSRVKRPWPWMKAPSIWP